ncbi:hypothetical protein G6F22_011955 [Rhizopus arrhizus]|nr:hypothetical protein G6F22_011955 [Rhizopus arrhizus]
MGVITPSTGAPSPAVQYRAGPVPEAANAGTRPASAARRAPMAVQSVWDTALPDGVVQQEAHSCLGRGGMHHAVQLDGRKACLAGGRQPRQHGIQAIAPGDLAEGGGVQRVQADVQPRHARGAQVFGMTNQLRAIGRHGQVGEARHGRDVAGQVRHPAAQQRLAARQPDLADAQAHEQAHQPGHFVMAQPVGRGFEALEILGQAVAATQVAAVRDRDAQVVDPASKAVYAFGLAARFQVDALDVGAFDQQLGVLPPGGVAAHGRERHGDLLRHVFIRQQPAFDAARHPHDVQAMAGLQQLRQQAARRQREDGALALRPRVAPAQLAQVAAPRRRRAVGLLARHLGKARGVGQQLLQHHVGMGAQHVQVHGGCHLEQDVVSLDQLSHHEALRVHLVEAATGGLVGLRRGRLRGEQGADGALLVLGIQAQTGRFVQQHPAQDQRGDRVAHRVAGFRVQRQCAFQIRVVQFDAIDDDRHVRLLVRGFSAGGPAARRGPDSPARQSRSRRGRDA